MYIVPSASCSCFFVILTSFLFTFSSPAIHRAPGVEPPPGACVRVVALGFTSLVRTDQHRPIGDTGGPRFRTMDRGGCPSIGRIRLGGTCPLKSPSCGAICSSERSRARAAGVTYQIRQSEARTVGERGDEPETVSVTCLSYVLRLGLRRCRPVAVRCTASTVESCIFNKTINITSSRSLVPICVVACNRFSRGGHTY